MTNDLDIHILKYLEEREAELIKFIDLSYAPVKGGNGKN